MGMKADADAVRMGVREKFVDVVEFLGDLSRTKMVKASRSTSTGIVSLDAALGGKLPSGAIEIYGEASSGKTTLLYEVITTAQKSGFFVALCPTEYLDIPYMRKFGIDLDNLVLITGNCGESTLEGAMNFLDMHQDVPSLLTFDSATGLRPRRDEPGEWMVLWDAFLETALGAPLHSSTCIAMVNQVRMKRSVDPNRFFVEGVTTSTAKKIIDLFSARLELSRGESRDGESTMKVDIISNVVSKPSTILSLPLMSGGGVDTMKDLLRFGMDVGVVTQAGAWYSIDDKYKLGCGLQEAVKQLEESEEIACYLLDRVMVKA